MKAEKTGAGKTIVVADDDAGIVLFLSTYLESLGYKVISCGDGEAAMKAIVEHRPDLAILDVSMPGASGIVVTSQLRVHPDVRLRKTPIIILTAKSDTRHEAYSVGAGASAFIAKPVAPDDLARKINSLLAPRRAR